jgi:4'-phosphopantetheinyl transferase
VKQYVIILPLSCQVYAAVYAKCSHPPLASCNICTRDSCELTLLQAPEALATLPPAEQQKAKKFHFIRDARLSLGSSLLKRLFVVKTLAVPWSEIVFSRIGHSQHGKPCCDPEAHGKNVVDFNVSHQAGLVALVGCSAQDALVGVDITCVNERNEKRAIDREGFESFVDMHEEVFSAADLAAIKASEGDLDQKIRTFYAFWALKEAFVKLEGEALLADWLKETEFRNVVAPKSIKQGQDNEQSARNGQIEVWRNGKKEESVEMILQAFEENYLIATAIKKSPGSGFAGLPEMKLIDIEDDIMPFTE